MYNSGGCVFCRSQCGLLREQIGRIQFVPMEGSETVPRAVVKGDTERDGDTDSESSSPLYLYPDLPTKSNIGERAMQREILETITGAICHRASVAEAPSNHTGVDPFHRHFNYSPCTALFCILRTIRSRGGARGEVQALPLLPPRGRTGQGPAQGGS